MLKVMLMMLSCFTEQSSGDAALRVISVLRWLRSRNGELMSFFHIQRCANTDLLNCCGLCRIGADLISRC